MASNSIIKLRSLNTFISQHFTSTHHFHPRHLSTILNPDPPTPPSTKDKSRAALSLLKTEKNPQRIIDICREASLTPESHLDRLAFSIAISKLTDLKHFDGIRGFIEELLETRPDLKNDKFIAHAIVYYGQAGLLDDAFQLFDKMSSLGIRQNAKCLNALLFSCMVAKEYDEVKRVYNEFPGKYGVELTLDTYNTVIKSFCEAGLSSSCYSVIGEMVGNECKPNETTFGILIAGLYKEQRFEEVGMVLEMMRKHEVPVGITTYNTRIQCLCKLKKTGEAKELLDGLLLSGMKPNSVTYCHLILGYCKEGKLDEAKNLFNKMIKSGFKPNSDCYFTLISYMCKAGDYEAALKLCKQSMEKDWVPNFSTMKLLVAGLANSSRVEEARELVGLIKGRFPKNLQSWNEIEENLPKLEDV